MGRTATAILSTENLLHNLSVIKRHAPDSKVMAMIKANAYGHGLRSTARRLEHHVETLGVASIDEALALRKIGIKGNITLIEGVFEPGELLPASCEKFAVVFHHKNQVEWIENTKLPLPLTAWIKVDTGLGRLGFNPHEAMDFYWRLNNNPNIQKPIGIMSHFACADDKSHSANMKQIDSFASFGHLEGPKSFANSPAIFNFPEIAGDMVRPGLALYGISPIQGKTAKDLNLKPVMTLQTSLISVKTMKKGATIGYGSRYTCPEDMPVGIIAMGYGDGYPRTARDGTPLLVNNIRCELIGRVSMDMAAVDLRACPTADIGASVTLWGEGLPIEEVATFTNNIPYDLLCAVQSRVKFFWTTQN